MNLPINQIVCGDCLEVMKGWSDSCVDLVLTDPPYGIGFQSNSAMKPRHNALANDDDNFDIWSYYEDLWLLIKESGAIYIFCRWDVANRWSQFIKPDNQIVIPRGRCSMGDLDNFSVEYECLLFKGKNHRVDATDLQIQNNSHVPNPPPYKRRIGNLWNDLVSNEAWERAKHPTQKTIEVCCRAIEVSSKPNNLILDPFCGSGTTCVAAKKLGRRYIGIDISEKYCEIARMRIKAVESGVPVAEQKIGQKGLWE